MEGCGSRSVRGDSMCEIRPASPMSEIAVGVDRMVRLQIVDI